MPKTTIAAIAAPGGYAAEPTEITWTAADVANKNQATLTGKQLLLAYNSGAADPHTITITSARDEKGRLGDVTAFEIAAGEYFMYGPIPLAGWQQSDGKLYFEANHAEVKFAIITVP